MYYPDDIVEEVRAANDIVDVIGNYVHLQKRGSSYVGLCPFHNEKTPSFSVNPSKQLYYCFGCGAGGNVYTFLMEYESDSFEDAVKSLARRAGIQLPQPQQDPQQKKEAGLRQQLYEVNKQAASYYYYQLRKPQGAHALQYLQERQLSAETLKNFGLGYSNPFSDDLYRYLHGRNYTDELLKESGLIAIDEKRGPHDRFWNRVMFPIMDVNRRVIGFGGRVLGEGEPKYLNSPETKLFDKSRNLYGLHIAKHSRRQNLLLCEGYMDVISMHQAGFDHAVASLGTAFTSAHALVMKRYTSEVLICFDSDTAGRAAARRAIPILRQAGLRTRVVDTSPYKDPDEFIKAQGSQAFEERIRHAANSFLFDLSLMKEDYHLEDPDDKSRFIRETAKKLVVFEEKQERENYIQVIAREYGISAENLTELVNHYGLINDPVRLQTSQQPYAQVSAQPRVGRKEEDPLLYTQNMLLSLLSAEPSLIARAQDFIEPDDFPDPLCRQAADLIFTEYTEYKTVTPARILDQFTDPDAHDRIAAIFSVPMDDDADEAKEKKILQETIYRIKSASIERKLKESHDPAALNTYIQAKNSLQRLKTAF